MSFCDEVDKTEMRILEGRYVLAKVLVLLSCIGLMIAGLYIINRVDTTIYYQKAVSGRAAITCGVLGFVFIVSTIWMLFCRMNIVYKRLASGNVRKSPN